MSFHFEFVAKDAASALAQLEKQAPPPEVAAFISAAITRQPTNSDPAPGFYVKATGHLAQEARAYGQEYSNAQIDVRPVSSV